MNLKELSEHLNLSPTTVSRALNGFPEVSEKTRKVVQEAADRLGYAPSSLAKSLATGRSMTIGHIVPQSRSELLNPIFGDFIAGAGRTYSEQGYRMLINVVPDEDEAQTYRDLWRQRTVDGVMVHGPLVDEPRIEILRDIGIPFMVHGRTGGEILDYSFVDVNNRRAFHKGCSYLIELGHQRIAFLNGDEGSNFALRRRMGFESAHAQAGIKLCSNLMLSDDMSLDFGYRSFVELSKNSNPPTAYVCGSSVIALGVHQAVSEAGLKLGCDMSLFTHDDGINFLHKGDADTPYYTASHSSVNAAGRRCAELLIDLIENPDGKNRQELWDAELIIGSSTGPLL